MEIMEEAPRDAQRLFRCLGELDHAISTWNLVGWDDIFLLIHEEFEDDARARSTGQPLGAHLETNDQDQQGQESTFDLAVNVFEVLITEVKLSNYQTIVYGGAGGLPKITKGGVLQFYTGTELQRSYFALTHLSKRSVSQ